MNTWEPVLLALMGSLRAMGLVAVLPTPAARPLPAVVRVALAVSLGGLLAAVAPASALPPPASLGGLAVAAVHELLLGLAMGLVVRALLSAAELAGRLIAGEVGLIAAPGFDAPIPSQEPLPTFLGFFAGLLFFLLHAHEGVLAAYARSFEIAPAGTGRLSAAAGETLVQAVVALLELALRMAAPFIALNFVITAGFAILGRAVPKMNVFIVSIALRGLLGFMLLAGAGALFARYLAVEFDRLPWRLLELVGTR
jgi:flagellar biosynthetic protein FliR